MNKFKCLTILGLSSFIFLSMVLSNTASAAIVQDALSSVTVANGATTATQTITMTIGNNPQRLLVVKIGMVQSSPGAGTISTVKIGTTSFTKTVDKLITVPDGSLLDSSIWVLANPPTGSQTITITPTSTNNYYMIAGARSLYNVNTSTPTGATTATTGTTTTSNISVTPTSPNSNLDENYMAYTLGGNGTTFLGLENATRDWVACTSGGGACSIFVGGAQHQTNPTVGVSNTLTWHSNNIGTNNPWVNVVAEINTATGMNPPSLTKVNTVNSNSINIIWQSVTGATWYQLERASPNGGSFTPIANQSSTSFTDSGLTAGTQYQYNVRAGNSTTTSSFSANKWNYTYQVSPTSITFTNIKTTSARINWINPTGNVTGYFKIEKESPIGGGFSLVANTSNSTNRYDLSGLTLGTQYNVRISSYYGVGSNNSGVSAPSTANSFRTSYGTIPTGTILDDFRVYNKALSTSQITSLYNYRLISGQNYTDKTSLYPFVYKYNIAPVSDLGQIAPTSGSVVTIAPYNVIDPPFKLQTTLAIDSNGYFENINWTSPIIPNSICGSACNANGYQIQHYNTTTHLWNTDVTNQTLTSYKLYHINQNVTQNIRVLTNNHAGLSTYDFPFNQTTYPELLSHWNLQNNLLDAKSTNNGIIFGDWNFSSGKKGNAQIFNGVTYDKITSSGLPISTSDRTISMWINPGVSSSGSNAYFSTGGSSANSQFSLIDANGKIDCGGAGNNVNSTSTLSVGTWYLVSCTLHHSGTTREIYINGVLDKNVTTTTLNTISSNVFLGTRVDNNSKNVTASIGDVRIFSTALTQDQETELYNEAVRSSSPFVGNLVLNNNVGGNVAALNGTINIVSGFPASYTLTNYKVVNGSTLLNNTNVSIPFNTNSYNIPTVYEQNLSLVTPSSFKMNATITSGTGTSTLVSNVINTNGSYVPIFIPSVEGGFNVNYTVVRPNPGSLLTLYVNEKPVTFEAKCNYATGSELVAKSPGIWSNKTNIAVYAKTIPVHSFDNIYISCYDPDQLLFQTTSYGTGSSLLPGIAYLDASFGGFIGAPMGVFFILLVAGLATGKTAPTVLIIVLAVAAILGALGFFAINQGVWGLCLIAGALSIFAGKKLF